MEVTNSNHLLPEEPGITKETLLLRLLDELSAARNLAGKSILSVLVAALVILNHCSKPGTEREPMQFQIRISCRSRCIEGGRRRGA